MNDGDRRQAIVRYHAHLPELGRMVSAAGTIEFHVAGLLGEFISSDADVARLVLKRIHNFSRRRDLMRDLIAVRLVPPHPAAQMREQLLAWLTEAAAVMDRRNTYLHSMWLGAIAEAHPAIVSNAKSHEEVPLEELQRLVVEAEDLANYVALL